MLEPAFVSRTVEPVLKRVFILEVRSNITPELSRAAKTRQKHNARIWRLTAVGFSGLIKPRCSLSSSLAQLMTTNRVSLPWEPRPARYRYRKGIGIGCPESLLERVQEGHQVGLFFIRENKAQMNLVVSDHVLKRRRRTVVEVRRASRQGT
jgi:hypothetical protein